MRILGIDPSLRGTGYGIIEARKGTPTPEKGLAHGVIHCPAKLRQSECLVRISQTLRQAITEFEPDCVAVEGVIFVQSLRTAITLGAARGAALLTAAEAGLEIYEYAPKRVKQSVVGRGAADKSQVAFMVRALLQLTETPPPDAADALAIALTHARAMSGANAAAGRIAATL